MKLWELLPTSVESNVWRFTTYTGPVILRAHDENQARALASERFQTGPLSKADHNDVVIGDPWHSGLFVRCAPLPQSDTRWPMKGDPGIVYPVEWRERRRTGQFEQPMKDPEPATLE
jgi:hypothetical protein